MNHFELNIIDRKIKYNNIYKMDISQVQAVQIVCLINQRLNQVNDKWQVPTLSITKNFNNMWLLGICNGTCSFL